ncbi:MAG: sigma 54-interacting transcriptional regulator [Polyangiaceae bacterium]
MAGETHTETLSVDEPGVIPRFILQVTEGPDQGISHLSSEERVVIGTSESAQLRLADTAVSRFHCEVSPARGGVLVRDLGSRNGTTVSGILVREAVVPFGCTLAIGRDRIHITLQSEVAKLPLSPESRFGQLVGASAAMRHAFALLERAAKTDATVLLTGETGTGKEAAARAVHAASERSAGPFVVVDCASVPSTLFEAELFGHEKGSFTGAVAAREGAFELAQGGTLFIDEIGELGLDLQPKLLRVLERREVRRVGGNKPLPVDVRIVAATHRDLRAEVNQKRFRSDLYYRLAVVPVRLPALRERIDDLRLLVEALSESLRERVKLPTDRLLEQPFLDELARHAWPGNVRELRNYLERALVLGAAVPVDGDAAGNSHGVEVTGIDVSNTLREERERVVAAFEREYLERVLARANGVVSQAAQLADVDRVHFYRLLWRHGLRTRG